MATASEEHNVEEEILLTFDDLDPQRAASEAEALEQILRRIVADDHADHGRPTPLQEQLGAIRRVSGDDEMQGTDTIVSIILSSISVQLIAEGVRQFFASRSPHKLTIRLGTTTEVIAVGDSAATTADKLPQIIRELRR